MDEAIRLYLRETPLDQLGEAFDILAERVYAHRGANRGFVPREIFAFCVCLGGVYPCVEVVIEVVDARTGDRIGYALKKRTGGSEEGWEGQFQIVGTACRMTDDQFSIRMRLASEIFGDEAPPLEQGRLTLLGNEIHDEPERWAACWTAVYLLKIDSLKGFVDEWQIFTDPDDLSIIDHHRNTLKWAMDPQRPALARLPLI